MDENASCAAAGRGWRYNKRGTAKSQLRPCLKT
jgi:hypothetical protein